MIQNLSLAGRHDIPNDDRAGAGEQLAWVIDGTPAALAAAVEAQGPAALGVELRAIEAADARCTRDPRFKPHDDATALWLRIG